MTQVILPVSCHDTTPQLPQMRPRQLNWMGRIVAWIHKSEKQGWFHHALISTIMIIVSTILIFSVILSPLFIYGFKEFIIQKERLRHDVHYERLLEMANGTGRSQFLRGRLDPINKLNISLNTSARRHIICDLELTKEKAQAISDRDLLLAAAVKFDNFLERYHFDVRSRSQSSFWRAFGY